MLRKTHLWCQLITGLIISFLQTEDCWRFLNELTLLIYELGYCVLTLWILCQSICLIQIEKASQLRVNLLLVWLIVRRYGRTQQLLGGSRLLWNLPRQDCDDPRLSHHLASHVDFFQKHRAYFKRQLEYDSIHMLLFSIECLGLTLYEA